MSTCVHSRGAIPEIKSGFTLQMLDAFDQSERSNDRGEEEATKTNYFAAPLCGALRRWGWHILSKGGGHISLSDIFHGGRV